MYNYGGGYNYSYGNDAGQAALGVAAIILGVVVFFAICIGILMYVFEALSIYQIAKRRNFKNPWLAWIPVANVWLIGQIGDYYYMRDGKKPIRFDIWLLSLSIGGAVISIIPILGTFIGGCAMIAAMVFEYICFYQIFKHVCPQNAVMFTVLGVIFSVLMPFFLFSQRNNDDVTPIQAQGYNSQYNQTNYNQYGQQNYNQPNYNNQYNNPQNQNYNNQYDQQNQGYNTYNQPNNQQDYNQPTQTTQQNNNNFPQQ